MVEREWLVDISSFIHEVESPVKCNSDLNEEDKHALLDAEVEFDWRALVGHIGCDGEIVDITLYFELLAHKKIMLIDSNSLFRLKLVLILLDSFLAVLFIPLNLCISLVIIYFAF